MATTYPTQTQIAELPKWARVLFAARCARRLEQITLRTLRPPREFCLAVSWAIAEAELSAEYGVVSDNVRDAAKLADAAHESFQGAENSLLPMCAVTACWTAKAAQYAEEIATDAAYGASSAAQRYGCPEQLIQDDFSRLLSASQTRRWTDRSPASLDLLSPLPAPKPQDGSLRSFGE